MDFTSNSIQIAAAVFISLVVIAATAVYLYREITMPILKQVFLKPIEDKIAQCKSDNFIINLNYEIVIPDSGKSLLHCDYLDVTAMKGLFDSLYKEKLKFIPTMSKWM